MAQIDVNREKREGRHDRSLARREDYFPSTLGSGLWSWSPFSMMRRMMEDMDRTFGEFALSRRSESESGGWMPAIDVYERDGHLKVCAELPGLKPEDVKVEVTDDELIIRGERKREHEESKEGFYRAERSYGSFYRSVPLPEGVKAEEAKADFHDGELRVTIPISERKSRHREIPIGAGASTEQKQAGGSKPEKR
jgi:HSP20 family protein